MKICCSRRFLMNKKDKKKAEMKTLEKGRRMLLPEKGILANKFYLDEKNVNKFTKRHV